MGSSLNKVFLDLTCTDCVLLCCQLRRCRHEFCYLCGATWKTCGCPHWEEGRLVRAAAQRVLQNPEAQAMDQGQFQQAVENMAEALRTEHACPGHAWFYRQPPLEQECRNCGYWLNRYCYVCRHGICGTVVCRTCRFFRNVPL
jgi:hypothetical protein